MARLLSALLGLTALLMAATLPAAVAAAPAPVAVSAEAAAPCHAAPATGGKAEAKAKAKGDKSAAERLLTQCCGDGRCGGSCSPLVAFFRGLPGAVLSLLRSAIEAPVRAHAPLGLADTRERPPKPVA